MLDAVTLEFVTVGCTEYLVAGYLGCDDLANNVLVGETDNEAVFRGIVFVLGLGNQTLAGIVVCLARTTSFVLGLIAASHLSEGDHEEYSRERDAHL